jgi:hypothetical protein
MPVNVSCPGAPSKEGSTSARAGSVVLPRGRRNEIEPAPGIPEDMVRDGPLAEAEALDPRRGTAEL